MIGKKRFFDFLDDLDCLVSKTQPSDQDIDLFIHHIGRSPIIASYAFRALKDATWFQSLFDRGALMPNEIEMSNKRAILWPAASYLIHVLSLQSPDIHTCALELLNQARKMRYDELCRISAEIASALNAEAAEQWVDGETEWILSTPQLPIGYVDDLCQCLKILIRDGRSTAVLRLLSELFAIRPDTREKSEHGFHLKCSSYEYEHALDRLIPEIVPLSPNDVIALLCKLLDNAITGANDDPEKARLDDISVISRPAIEDSDQNLAMNVTDHLITALRDSVIAACAKAPDKLPEIVEILENHDWNVFQRITLYLLQVVDPVPVDLIEARLVDEEALNNSRLHHEYYHLLKRRFSDLKPESQHQILQWIDRADAARARSQEYSPDLSDQEREEYLDSWRFTKLSALEGQLPPAWEDRLKQLQAKRPGRDMPPDYLSWSGTWSVGNQSPKTCEELSAMSLDTLVEYLKKWEPSGEWPTPTPDGLGSALSALIEKNTATYIPLIEHLMDEAVDPTYVRHAIRGYSKGFQAAEGALAYEPLFKLFRWLLNKPRAIPGRKVSEHVREGLEADMDWGNARHEMADFFEDIFPDKYQLPYTERERVWGMICQLTEDPMPDEEHERKYGGRNSSALDMSINTVRGKALHAVFHYAMWVYRHIQKQLKAEQDRKPNFSDLPEVREVLDAHLDVTAAYGQRTTDRAVYGKWLPSLVFLDEEWVQSKLTNIFPSDSELKHLRDAAWHSYLLYSGSVYSQATKVLRPIYTDEVEALQGVTVEDGSTKMAYTRLVDHVILLYVWGEESLSEDGLVHRLFHVAPAELTAHAFDFIGRTLNNENRVFEGEMLKRLQKLWNWRKENVGGYDNMPKDELSTFGWWFSCGSFDSAWAYGELEDVLKRTSISRSNIYVFDRMSEWFKDQPAETLRCLRLFIESDSDRWMLHSTRKTKGIWTILEQGMAHSDEPIRDEADILINRLGEKGFLEYRELRKKNK